MRQLYHEFRQKLERDARERVSKRQAFQLQRDKAADDRKKTLKKVVEREQRLEDAAKLWCERFIPEFESRRHSDYVREVCWSVGIPPKLRGEVWPLAIDNALMITPELYGVFCTRAAAVRQSHMASQAARAFVDAPAASAIDASVLAIGKENTIDYIAVDLERTFPTLAFFQVLCHSSQHA